MHSKLKIPIFIPGAVKSSHYFYLPLRQNISDERSEYQKSGNILIIANFEEDFQSLCHILKRRSVIDKYLEWTFDNNQLFIIGSGGRLKNQESEYLWFLYYLQEKAWKKGGYVHFIPSNQDILNLNGSWRYAHPKYAAKRTDSKNPSTAFYYGNNELWHWLHAKNIIEKIGSFLFVPAGISVAVNDLGYSLSRINELVRKYFTTAGQPHTIPEVELLLNSDDSPLKYKGYFDGSATEKHVNNTLKKFRVKTIVTAYEGAAPGIYFDGKVINIAKDAVNGDPGALFIKREYLYLLDSHGKRRKVY